MDINMTEYIKLCCVKKGGITMAELARRTGQTKQNLKSKMERNNPKVSELDGIAKALDAELQIKFIDKETGKPII